MIQNLLTQNYFCPRIRLVCTNNSTCFSALLTSPVFTLPSMLLSTQKPRGICKQLFCILCLCSKHQITEIEYQSISFHEFCEKIMLMGALHPTKLSVKQRNCDNLYISIHRPQWQVSGFVLSCRQTPSRAFPPCHWVSSCWQKGTKVFPFLVYIEVPFALQNISPMRIFMSFHSLTFQGTSLKLF